MQSHPQLEAGRMRQGENLYWQGGSSLNSEDVAMAQAVQSWYDEMNDYDFRSGASKNGGVIGHFTQLVWKQSTEVGCAFNSNCNNMFGGMNNVVVVCRYSPPGNYMGQYVQNVGPLNGEAAANTTAGAARVQAKSATSGAALLPPQAD